MPKKELYTIPDLAAKVDWEGDLFYAIYHYGISSDEIPEGRVKEIWAKLEKLSPEIYELERLLSDALEELN